MMPEIFEKMYLKWILFRDDKFFQILDYYAKINPRTIMVTERFAKNLQKIRSQEKITTKLRSFQIKI